MRTPTDACRHGHALTGSNVYEHTDRHGHHRRMCRTCRAARAHVGSVAVRLYREMVAA